MVQLIGYYIKIPKRIWTFQTQVLFFQKLQRCVVQLESALTKKADTSYTIKTY